MNSFDTFDKSLQKNKKEKDIVRKQELEAKQFSSYEKVLPPDWSLKTKIEIEVDGDLNLDPKEFTQLFSYFYFSSDQIPLNFGEFTLRRSKVFSLFFQTSSSRKCS